MTRLASAILGALVLCSGCKGAPQEEGELTRADCSDMVRRIQKIESSDTGGLADALNVSLKPEIERCLRKGTASAQRCVMQSQSKEDLASCDLLFR